ncbi:lon protease [Candidatus Kuenenia stuttgartiensis]|jgi:ATP-dependent Lon protease|uniref:Lon protease n=1 Tax=Kuenenia stuttgartiensis TaxID=174633 RepID=Q1PXW3_KUEST|nr:MULTISPECIES: endopeptidase La [Kuenenia]MBE7546396.1 endopeptidase La [Planctomycetia bacterium]MBW7941170.1 endopeptidase La [Candidatus Kuenenia stuttgartiensis]MBZ0192473.1 endopeptidase La [Candidatus Kuenenia stuttgartiensis]MCF6151128.1 endopeptidase La [Candidatus Kuenenia stuttgartiensis]MCL4725721.1 endopeptidase La [Candidatus Kuenenia stuttgartiensis]
MTNSENNNHGEDQEHPVLTVEEEVQDKIERIKIPHETPVLPVKDTVVFPGMVAALSVYTDRDIKLLNDVLAGNRFLTLTAQKDKDIKVLKQSDIYECATAAVVLQMLRMPDNSAKMLVQGLRRVKIGEYVQSDPYFKAKISAIEDIIEDDRETEALARNAADQFAHMISMMPSLPEELKIAVVNIENPSRLADLITSHLNVSVAEKQKVLELANVKLRLQKVTTLIASELEVLEMATKIQSQVRNEMEKGQKEYYLRQQLKAIQDELGEGDERSMEIKELKEKIENAKMPAEAKKEAERELERLAKMHSASAEYTVSRTYLDLLIALPWSVSTKDQLDIKTASTILDEDHYDLEKLKERILEYLAVRKLKDDMKGPILCFVGPPGTGKTSVGMSIARSMGRKFVRMSLGGVRDEAEIRGHRRTYIGALPGRIIQGLKKAESNNPVFMLDEIDKLGADFRGDPSAALLEVLDPEQNHAFSDHYLDVAFDLSNVMFITTANILDTVPPALKDRMEVLELSGYTAEEKISIVKKFILPKQLKAHGLKEEQLTITDDAIKMVITDYTREAGLRNLEREIAHLCRKTAKKIASGEETSVTINAEQLNTLLGPIKFFSEAAERTTDAGVATGLAWTQAGGDILFIEATFMPGTGKLTLTGCLGDIMKESAQAAMSYIRSKLESLKISFKDFDKYDFHIHVPAGAIPKDGPSAGVTMAMALISLLKGTPILSNVAMTGEITLRGRVLPVGGIKEKVLAAKRAGITTVVLPKRNEKDLTEVPENAKKRLNFAFVERVDEMLPIVFGAEEPKKG